MSSIKKLNATMDVQDLSLSTPEQLEQQAIAQAMGSAVYHTSYREGYPSYEAAPCEKVISGDNNAHIILGRDRPYSFGSGMGAFGGKCGRIHLIAGLASASKLKNGVGTGPNLITDAATVYISQRTRIDEFFGLPMGTNSSSKDASGIGIKADHVRIIGREHVKIYAGGAMNISKPNRPFKNILGLNKERNSKGGDIISRGRIDLIADNYEDIQPAVKGQNLIEHLKSVHDMMAEIIAEMNSINLRAAELNNALILHQHPEVLGIGGTPGIALTWKIFSQWPGQFKTHVNAFVQNINLVVEEINYLGFENADEDPVPGFKSILSDSVYLT
tara:strand:+ start:43 stop:1032 length:990 start_codon:yes stop_codon:yes gene_type:complete